MSFNERGPRGPQISRAVADRPHSPVFPRGVTPERRRPNNIVRNFARVGLVATVGVSAAIGANAILRENNSDNHPQESNPIGIVEPSSSPVPTAIKPGESIPVPSQNPGESTNPSGEPTPSAEVTPKPTPTETTPAIEKVKVVGGYARKAFSGAKPYYTLDIHGATIVDIGPINPETHDQWIALSTTGKKIKREKIGDPINGFANGKDLPPFQTMDYSGATYWLNIKPNTDIRDSHNNIIGKGPEYLDTIIHVGDRFTLEQITFGNIGGLHRQSASEFSLNKNSFNKLNASLGKHYPRSTKIFKFIPNFYNVEDQY